MIDPRTPERIAEEYEARLAALRERAEAAEKWWRLLETSIKGITAERDAFKAEVYHLKGELKEILEMISTLDINPGEFVNKIRHKIEGIPALAAGEGENATGK